MRSCRITRCPFAREVARVLAREPEVTGQPILIAEVDGRPVADTPMARPLEQANFQIRFAQLQVEFQTLQALGAFSAEVAAQIQGALDGKDEPRRFHRRKSPFPGQAAAEPFRARQVRTAGSRHLPDQRVRRRFPGRSLDDGANLAG